MTDLELMLAQIQETNRLLRQLIAMLASIHNVYSADYE